MPETRYAKKVLVPEISDDKLAELCAHIRPIVRMKGGVRIITRTNLDGSEASWTEPDPEAKPTVDRAGEQWYVKPVDPRKIAFTWDPEMDVKVTGLKKLCDIRTLHSFAYSGFFKPTVAEVIAQIPAEHLDSMVAFEIIKSPEDASEMNEHSEETANSYHVATTRLYVRA